MHTMKILPWLLTGLLISVSIQAQESNTDANADWLNALDSERKKAAVQNNREQADIIAPKSVSFATNTRDEDELRALRLKYFQAVKALKRNEIEEYQQHLKALENYPIVDYLEYTFFDSLPSLLPVTDRIKAYAQAHRDLTPAQWILSKAALEYGQGEHWDAFESLYPLIDTPSQSLRCIKARRDLSKPSSVKQASSVAAKHWRDGRALNGECAKLTDAWKDAKLANPQDHWTRFYRASVNRRVNVAKSASKYVADTRRAEAKLLILALEQPAILLADKKNLRANRAINRSAVLIALNQLARIDVADARKHWKYYQAKHRYDLGTRKRIHKLLTRYTAWRDDPALAAEMVKQIPLTERAYTLQIVLRELLRSQQWDKAYQGIKQLDKKNQNSDRWRYWKARLQVLTDRDDNKPAREKAFMVYRALAKKRGYYGYLSADITGQDYQAEHLRPRVTLSADTLYERMPGLLRARELYALNETPLAKGEWIRATRGRSKDEYVGLAQLALDWSWYHMSVQSMIDAKLWDALDFRFPKQAYADSFASRANKFGLAPNLLFAIARQESAFDRTARSPVGARGLMQLMPYTAKETADWLEIETSDELLSIPDHNIELGSAYIDQMLADFNNNRIFAIAAYNAGPHRVTDWRARSQQTLPFDVWIETIPFKETRGYVQNVLTYYVLYSYLHGQDTPLIQEHERNMLY